MDFWRKLFNEPLTLVAIVSSGIIGFVVGIANGVIQKKHGGWPGFFQALVTAITVSVLVGLAVQRYVEHETVRLAIVGVCALISDDILAGLKAFGAGVRKDPLAAISRLIDALRGKSVAPAPDTVKE